MPQHKVIGTTLFVKLPSHSGDDIPAKVDTGADISAIWASSINEKDGVLSFALFGPRSIYYTGEFYSVTDYRVNRVRNSFGESEYRYKIKLSVQIAGKQYKAFFNLSDRSRNRFPILIGRRFLHSRFVVDVSKSSLSNGLGQSLSDRPIVVLTSRTDIKTKEFFNIVAKEASAEILLEKYRKINYEINNNGEPKITLSNGKDIACSRLVYFKAYRLYPEHAIAIADYLKYKNIPFIDKELNNSVSRSKFSEIFRLATNSIPVPQTKIITGQLSVTSYDELSLLFGNKFVIKDVGSDRGKNNYLVIDADSFSQAIERLDGIETVMVQRFIENDGFLRVLMMGNKLVQIVERSSAYHKDPLRSHLNKPFGGDNATELSVTDCGSDVIAIARKAALVTHRSVVGVDLIKDKNTNKWYVLEVNYNPEVSSGKNILKKAKGLAHLFESKNQ